MPRIMQIDNFVLKEIEKVKKYALTNIYNKERIQKIIENIEEPPGYNPDHVVHIHQGFRVVYTIEDQDGILYHHASLSYEKGMIGVIEVEAILAHFGILNNIHDADHITVKPGDSMVINVYKRVENVT